MSGFEIFSWRENTFDRCFFDALCFEFSFLLVFLSNIVQSGQVFVLSRFSFVKQQVFNSLSDIVRVVLFE